MFNRDVKRLLEEWNEHGKIILAVDFDDTIKPWRHRTEGECRATIETVIRAQSVGIYLVVHTTRTKDRFDEIYEYCGKYGINVHSINTTPIDVPFGKGIKPYYNWQLCDRSGLNYSEKVLEEVINLKRK